MKRRTVLLTGARAPAALEWARQFARAGWRVLAADSMPRPLAAWSRAVDRTWLVPSARHDPGGFVDAVGTICEAGGVRLVIPVCEEIFALSRGADRLPLGCRLWAEPLDRLQELHDKNAFITLSSRLGLPVPISNQMTSPHEVGALSGDWFLKPCFSRFAVGGRRWNNVGGSESVSREAWLRKQEISPSRPWVAQEFLAGQGWCAYALAEAGKILLLVCYPVEWTAGAGACVAFTARPNLAVEAWVREFIEAAALTGQLAFDFIDVPGRGALPLECNPRATSGIHLLPHAASILTGALEKERGVVNPVIPVASSASGNPDAGSAMLSLPMLLYGLPQAVRRGAATAWLRTWHAAGDVTFAAGDSAPAWLGGAWTMWWFAKEARRLRCGLTAATTADLEWNGDFNTSLLPE